MTRRNASLVCALAALSPTFAASDDGSPSAPAEERSKETGSARGVSALFSWADLDGDGRLDLAAVTAAGALQVLTSIEDGQFEDVTERLGLGGVREAALALWADYDADGRLDLFVGARSGASRIFRNEGGSFTDMSAGSGFVCEGAVQSAQWLDHDGDGRLDLFVATAAKNGLYRGIEGGFFERAELPLGALEKGAGPEVLGNAERTSGADAGEDTEGRGTTSAPTASDTAGVGRRGGSLGGRGNPNSGGRMAVTPTVTEVAPLLGFTCASAIVDQANPTSCLQASTTPTLGKLYPLSSNLFVAVGGNVGIGTTSPTARLHVAGTARMTDTLTLAPSGDMALDVSTGSIYKGGALFIHTKGFLNTAVGRQALASVTTGSLNAASGYKALFSNTTGDSNTASGYGALYSNTTGFYNTASGYSALRSNTTGSYNTASGVEALGSNTSGNSNTASGYKALAANTTASFNTAQGYAALQANTTGFENTATGVYALKNNTTGYRNTASGVDALRSNTGGYSNTASGFGALRSNTTGGQNTATGVKALYSNTLGHRNTASGYRALYSNTTGTYNTASGYRALGSNTTAVGNTANGFNALEFNTIGSYNTAVGFDALRFNDVGSENAAFGLAALSSNTAGIRNTADGFAALLNNTTGGLNTAAGHRALFNNTSGYRNTAVGYRAGFNLTTGGDNIAVGNRAGYYSTGSDNIFIGNRGNFVVPGESNTIRIGTPGGTHTRAFVAGIRGVTTSQANAIPVLIDSNGQLGTVSSSRRFKEDIRDMGAATERLLDLRPVLFRYKQEQTLPNGQVVPPEYGLIAEEVAEIFPDLVVYDEEGQPFTVKYHLLSSMLLNELEKLDERCAAESVEQARALAELADLRAEVARLRTLETRLEAVEAGVTGQVATGGLDARGH